MGSTSLGPASRFCTLAELIHRASTKPIHNHVPLAIFDLFSRIKTSLSSPLGRFYTLAVENRNRGFFSATLLNTNLSSQRIQCTSPYPHLRPFLKVVIDELPVLKIVRKVSPWDSRSIEVDKSIHDLPTRCDFIVSTSGDRGNPRFQERPFGIGPIGWIRNSVVLFFIAAMASFHQITIKHISNNLSEYRLSKYHVIKDKIILFADLKVEPLG